MSGAQPRQKQAGFRELESMASLESPVYFCLDKKGGIVSFTSSFDERKVVDGMEVTLFGKPSEAEGKVLFLFRSDGQFDRNRVLKSLRSLLAMGFNPDKKFDVIANPSDGLPKLMEEFKYRTPTVERERKPPVWERLSCWVFPKLKDNIREERAKGLPTIREVLRAYHTEF